MKGYKAFNVGWKCRDFQYKIGETYELPADQELKICQCGFHFCKNPIDVFGYYPMDDDTVIAEVEALGKIEQEGTKYVTNKIKIVREFTRDELQLLILDGHYNSGHYNSGRHNSGDFNSGDLNSGDHNSGDHNSGDCNSGRFNSGDFNSGRFNSGDHNSGDFNSGRFNSGDHNSGIFNTNEPLMRAFNKPTATTYTAFVNSLDYNFYFLCARISENRLWPEDTDRIKSLPNFDAKIFEGITGIHIE